jgi:thiosulfate reductase cytochrome b subunit
MHTRALRIALWLPAALAAAAAIYFAAEAGQPAAPAPQASALHPDVVLLDSAGRSVLDSGAPASGVATCGQCHDAAFIQQHDSHADAGLNPLGPQWDPVIYRFQAGSATEQSLPGPRQTRSLGEANCFVCHMAAPDNNARLAALEAGDAAWATSATLAGTSLLVPSAAGWQWNRAAFGADGTAANAVLGLQSPSDASCAQCHGMAHPEASPVVVAGCAPEATGAAASGQVFAAERISNSGANLAAKDSLSRPWDVHAERGLSCTDCHFAANNPARVRPVTGAAADHLTSDPRRLPLGEYLERPSHELATAQCTDCHAAEPAHSFLPYAARHLSELACETCHVPQVYAPAVQRVDWTVLTPDGGPRTLCRGTEGDSGTPADLVTGYVPALLPGDGGELAPFNLTAAWYWEHDAGASVMQPVPLSALRAAFFDAEGRYAAQVLAAFDANGDGRLDAAELVIDTAAKESLIAARLRALGLAEPRLAGQVRAYALNHGVATGTWALSDCRACHGDNSRLAEPTLLGSALPGSVFPPLAGAAASEAAAAGLALRGGSLIYTTDAAAAGLYVFGHSRAAWADWLGALAFVGVLAAVSAHGGLRALGGLQAARAGRPARHPAAGQHVYMYAVYERFWHWLQTFTIVLLLFTGLIIHRPDVFAAFSFRHAVLVHNVLAAILVINAALALFYHLASGEIRQFLPRPYGFFDQAIVQARYYLRGIFHGQPHPFEKTPARKLNPLQQLTYLAILNVLLPLMVLTGALMWGAQQWPELAARLGGLPLLAPLHSLGAWLFAAFIVAHVYLTTTGREPLAGIQAMMHGWEAADARAPAEEVSDHERAHPGPQPGPDQAAESAVV